MNCYFFLADELTLEIIDQNKIETTFHFVTKLYDLRVYYYEGCWISLEPEHDLSCDNLTDELNCDFDNKS